MKTSARVLFGVGAVAAMVLLPRCSNAQPGGDEGGGGPPEGDDESGGGAPEAATEDCPQDGSNAHYDEFLDGEGELMVRWVATNTGCPNHVNWPLNPNSAGVLPSNTSVPAFPMLFEDGGTTDLSSAAGNIGLMRNGVAMFSSWANPVVETYEDTAFFLEGDGFDPCGGHATPTGSYHYHGTAGCLQEQAGGVVGQHSPLLGWAYDGFPFYGQLGPGGVEMKMCGADGADPTVCLDGCSGYEAFIDEDEFAYRYYTSCGFDESFFPFTANCFRGCCPAGMTCSQMVEACGDNPEIGYTDDHVPEPSTPLDEQFDAMLIDGDDIDIIGSNFSVDCTLYLGIGGGDTGSAPEPTLAPTAGQTAAETTGATAETTAAGTIAGSLCKSIGCPNAFIPIPDAQTTECVGVCSIEQCCESFCSFFACPNGFTSVEDAGTIQCNMWCSTELCCVFNG